MKVAIIGYGKMGKQIEKVLKDKNINDYITIDKFNPEANFKEYNSESTKGIDVAIDFSFPETALDNIKKSVDYGVNLVMGTTGWYDKLEEVKKIVGDKIGFIWSGNFSLGVNIFFRIIENASKIFDKFNNIYDVMSYELHHKEKKDSPSGTEIMIGNILKENLSNKNKLVEDKLDRKIENNEIHVASIRGGYIPGTHTVLFDSIADTVELTHRVRTREGLATGAVLAAEWIYGKKGFFNIDDLMNELIG